MMRKKFYITFGRMKYTILANSSYQACIKAYERYIERNFPKNESGEYENTVYEDYYEDGYEEPVAYLPGAFIVSKKGHEGHNDDEVVETELIIKLLLLCYQPVDKNG